MTRKEQKNYYTTTRNYADHSTFGGEIYSLDFNTGYRGDNQKESTIAKRIASDWNFDYMCKQNALNRDRNKNYKKEVK